MMNINIPNVYVLLILAAPSNVASDIVMLLVVFFREYANVARSTVQLDANGATTKAT